MLVTCDVTLQYSSLYKILKILNIEKILTLHHPVYNLKLLNAKTMLQDNECTSVIARSKPELLSLRRRWCARSNLNKQSLIHIVGNDIIMLQRKCFNSMVL